MTRKEREWLDGWERAARWWGYPRPGDNPLDQPVLIDLAITHCLATSAVTGAMAKAPTPFSRGYLAGLMSAWGV